MRKQAIPFKGPPMIVDSRNGFAPAEMPAIACWLGEKHGLLPAGVDGKATLWGTLAERFPAIEELLDAKAPAVAGLVRRLMAEPALANLAQVSREQFGHSYCGGEIEKSMRRVINHGTASD